MDSITIRARLSAMEDSPQKYIELYQPLLALSREHIDFEVAQNLVILGRAYLITGHHDLAHEPLHIAREYLETQEAKHTLFYCYNNLGVVYRELGENTLALDVFSKAYHLSYEIEDFVYVIVALMQLGSIYAEFEDRSHALEYFEKAIQYKSYIEDSKELGDLLNNYAYVLLKENRFEEAMDLFKQALHIYQKFYKGFTHINTIIAYANIGEAYFFMQAYENALEYYQEGLRLSELSQIDFMAVECHQKLSEIFEKKQQYEKALYHFKNYTDFKAKVTAEESHENMEKMREKFLIESQKSEAEIHALRNVALKNKTMELEKTLKNVSMISTMGQKLISSMDMDEIYINVKSSIGHFIETDIFGLAIYDSDKQRISYKYFEEHGAQLPNKIIEVGAKRGLASYAILNETDVYVPDIDDKLDLFFDDNIINLGDHKERARCIIYCRLLSEDQCIGLITLQSYTPALYAESDFEIVKALASYIAIAISNAVKKNIISEKAQELEYLSFHDSLTNLYNRRYFSHFIQTCRDYPVGLIIGDMNNLKYINDHYGHLMGDEYLISVAQILKKTSGLEGVFRLSGDEFAVVIPHAKVAEVEQLIERIQKACRNNVTGLYPPLSIALGYSVMERGEGDLTTLFANAETAMYDNKKKYHKQI